MSFWLRSIAVLLALGESCDASRQSQSTPSAKRTHGKNGAAYPTRGVSETHRTGNSQPQGRCVYQSHLEKSAGSEKGSRRYCCEHETCNVWYGWDGISLCIGRDNRL